MIALLHLKIRTKAYLAAAIATGVLAILALIFVSVLHSQNHFLSDVENVYSPRTAAYTEYFSRLSQTHAQLFDILVTAQDELDEEELYTTAKPKLLELRDLVSQMAESRQLLQLSAADLTAYDNLMRIMKEYVGQAVSAIEMATVDVNLARTHMVNANKSYQTVNQVLLELVASSRVDTSGAISLALDSIRDHTVNFTIILVLAVVGLGLFGWTVSHSLVRALNAITHDMSVLASGNTEVPKRTTQRTDEIGDMAQALIVFRDNAIENGRMNTEIKIRERQMQVAKEQAEKDKFDAVEKMRVALEEKAHRERELLHAQKMESLGTLAGGVAHEINTPIQYVGDNLRFLQQAFSDIGKVLNGCTNLIKDAGDDRTPEVVLLQARAHIEAADIEFLDDEIPTAIDQSLDGISRVSEIVQAIKEFSHPDSKEKSAIDINHAISNTIAVSRNQWKYVADLETELGEDLPPVHCLPGEINQVILNLIVNASHAIEAVGEGIRGRITVRTRLSGDCIEIEVSDTGVGMPEKIMSKIFEPFFTTKEPGKGTGQGLSISHNIITKKHGGKIRVHSTPGEGTTFAIHLPLGDKGHSEEAA